MSNKENQIHQTCLQQLIQYFPIYFGLLSDLQLVRASTCLASLVKGDEFFSKYNKIWEEIIYPFKLMAECEKKYYEWNFLTNISIDGNSLPPPLIILGTDSNSSSTSSSASSRLRRSLSGTSSNSGAAGDNDEDSLKYKYSQIPVALKKTMQTLHKFIVQQAQQQALNIRLQQQQQQQQQQQGSLPHSISSTSFLNNSSSSNSSNSGISSFGSPKSPNSPSLLNATSFNNNLIESNNNNSMDGRSTETIFTSTLLLLEEIVSKWVPLKISLIQFYQCLQSESALTAPPTGNNGNYASRARDINYNENLKYLSRIRIKVEKSFGHPHLIRLKDSLLLPELFLLEKSLGFECDEYSKGFIPKFDWKHSTFTLMHIKAEHTRWLNRIVTKDKEFNSGSGTHNTNSNSNIGTTGGGGVSSTLSGAVGSSGGRNLKNQYPSALTPTSKHSPLLLISVTTATIPSLLHWIHQFSHSLLCKSTLLFWHATAARSLEIRGVTEEISARLDRLDTNYVALFDKFIKKIPNCYSISLIMDCTLNPSGIPIPDPLHPLQLADSAVNEDELELAAAASAQSPSIESDDGTTSPVSPPSVIPQTGGLGQYPVLFHWPTSRTLLEKWNLVSILQLKGDLMADLSATVTPPVQTSTGANATQSNTSGHQHSSTSTPPTLSLAHSRPFPLSLLAPLQSSSQLVALGPSNHPSDLLIWDFENELPIPNRNAGVSALPTVPIGAVSYFVSKMDINKNVWIVVTFQNGCNNGTIDTNTSSSQQQQQQQSSMIGINPIGAPSRETSSGVETNTESATGSATTSAVSTPSHSGSVTGIPVVATTPSSSSSVLLSAAARRRTFDLIVAEITPIIQRLRHLHVMQHLLPKLGVKKS
jgi:hypothetical protein